MSKPRATRKYSQWRLEKLSDPERAARYLNAAKRESKEAFLYALKNVIQAHQVSKIAKDAGVSRESVYRSFSADGNPTLYTFDSVLDVLGMDWIIQSKSAPSPNPEPSGTTIPSVKIGHYRGVSIKSGSQKAHGFESLVERASQVSTGNLTGKIIGTSGAASHVLVLFGAGASLTHEFSLQQETNEEPWTISQPQEHNQQANQSSTERRMTSLLGMQTIPTSRPVSMTLS
jgi:probable addiction module antidote protein